MGSSVCVVVCCSACVSMCVFFSMFDCIWVWGGQVGSGRPCWPSLTLAFPVQYPPHPYPQPHTHSLLTSTPHTLTHSSLLHTHFNPTLTPNLCTLSSKSTYLLPFTFTPSLSLILLHSSNLHLSFIINFRMIKPSYACHGVVLMTDLFVSSFTRLPTVMRGFVI